MLEFWNRLPPLVRVPLRYGIIGGILGFVLVIILYYINRHPFLIQPFFDFRVALFAVFMFFALKELRDYYFNGLLFFWQGLAACWLFVITFAIVASSLIWIFALNVPDFVTQYIELATNYTKSFPKEAVDQIGKDRYDQTLAEIPKSTGLTLAKKYFGQSVIFALFISIIISVILRRQPKTTNL